MSLCITFESLIVESSLWPITTSSGDGVKFVYEGHRVKVKVTAAKKGETQYSRNVKFQSAVSPVL